MQLAAWRDLLGGRTAWNLVKEGLNMDREMDEVPIGFSLAMIGDIRAMNAFAGMSEDERREVIEEARNVTSKAEMEKLIERLGTFPM